MLCLFSGYNFAYFSIKNINIQTKFKSIARNIAIFTANITFYTAIGLVGLAS
jgi:hypothetical protein